MPRPLILVLIVALCGALDVGLHMAAGDLMPLPSEFSALVDRFGFGPVAAIAVLFLAIGDAMRGLSRATAALAFGLGVFGANWALFMTFVPMVFPVALADTMLRVGLDIVLVTDAALLVRLRALSRAP